MLYAILSSTDQHRRPTDRFYADNMPVLANLNIEPYFAYDMRGFGNCRIQRLCLFDDMRCDYSSRFILRDL